MEEVDAEGAAIKGARVGMTRTAVAGTVNPSSAGRANPARCGPRATLHFGARLPKKLHELGFETGPAACSRRRVTTMTEPGALTVGERALLLRRLSPLDDSPGDAVAAAASSRDETGFARQFAAEWLALLFALAVVGGLIAWSLFKAHQAVDATERDRLRVQARVVDDNVGQQLDGMNRALASVRDEFLATPIYSVSTLLSVRLKALSDAIPGVRSMVLLDVDGNVVASSVDTLLGRDFANRDYFAAARAGSSAETLHVATPLKTSIDTYTVVFARAIRSPNGAFAGTVAAALEPEYFQVLLRSVLYAPDMWVSLGHGDGKVFVTMPEDARRREGDLQPGAVAGPQLRNDPSATPIVVGAIGSSNEMRMTAFSQVAPPALHLDKPLVIAVSRALPELFAPWRQQALAYSTFFALLSAGAAFGLYRGQWRRKSYASLEASAEVERRKTAEQLELALEGAGLGLWDWDVRQDLFLHNEVVRAAARLRARRARRKWRGLARPRASRRCRAADLGHRGPLPARDGGLRMRVPGPSQGRPLGLAAEPRQGGRARRLRHPGADGRHPHGPERAQARPRRRCSARPRCCAGPASSPTSAAGSSTSRRMRVDWSEQVFRIHELDPGAHAAPGRSDRPLRARGPAVDPGRDRGGAREGTPWDLELPFITARGNARWVRAQGVAVSEDGKPVRLLGAFQDITEKKTNALELQRLNEELTRLSTTDALTEVGNRRLFDQTLRTEWARAARRGAPIGLLMIDVDHFKEYNDHYGHPAGDACCARSRAWSANRCDAAANWSPATAARNSRCCCPAPTSSAARDVAERCRQAWPTPRSSTAPRRRRPGSASASASPARWRRPSVDCGVLVEIADAALYRAKRCGRGRIEF